MSITSSLISFGLRYVFNDTADELFRAIQNRMTDHSQTLPQALAKANEQAWKAVGLALAGERRFQQLRDLATSADMKGVRDQFKKYLEETPTGLDGVNLESKTKAYAEWQQLQKAGKFTLIEVPGIEIARQAATFERHGDPARMALDAHRVVQETAEAISNEAPNLAAMLTVSSNGGPPLLASAFAFFFRREVETNTELAHGLSFDFLRQISIRQERGLALLDFRTEGILDQISILSDDVGHGFETTIDQLQEIRRELIEIKAIRHFSTGINEPLRVSVTNEREQQAIVHLRNQMRKLPAEILNANDWAQIGDALAAAGLFIDANMAQKSAVKKAINFAEEAEAEFKIYRNACEQKLWDEALGASIRAAKLDPRRFSLFPTDRYEAVSILGIGGFGTVFRCKDKYFQGRDVAIKTIHTPDLGRDVNTVFDEAHTLSGLTAPGIIKVKHWDFADIERKRPYIVMEYFPGISLATHIEEHGSLPLDDFLDISLLVAEAMNAAHTSHVLHRDLKPGNILLRQINSRWDVRVIDFGLAIRLKLAQASINTPVRQRTRRDMSFAGSIEYASPEQKGTFQAEVGPWSDIYSFGRTMLEALFKTTQPVSEEWDEIEENRRNQLRRLLERCIVTDPKRRHSDFLVISKGLLRLKTSVNVDHSTLVEDAQKTGKPGIVPQVDAVLTKPSTEDSQADQLSMEKPVAAGLQEDNEDEKEEDPKTEATKTNSESTTDKSHQYRNYRPTYDQYRQEAEQGDVNAQFELGMALLSGKRIEKDETSGAYWLRKAAEQGYWAAQMHFGLMLATGRGVSKDETEAAKWYRKVTEQKDCEGQLLTFACELAMGINGETKNGAAAYGMLLIEAEIGNSRAFYWLGNLLETGDGVEKDDTAAVEWYRKAADQGNASAQCNLGWMLVGGRGITKDEKAAVEWFRKAADQGLADAQSELGDMLRDGRGVEKDEKAAVEWYRKAADQNNVIAQNNLGMMLANGRGNEKDDAEAIQWFRKAAEHGAATAQTYLGEMLKEGRGVEKDDIAAFGWYRKAADQGNVIAQVQVGFMLCEGIGVDKDEAAGVSFFKKAADLGNAMAQRNLGIIFRYGRGVMKNEAVAVEWLRKSSEQGLAHGECDFGEMLRDGLGMEKDESAAVQWFRKAAEQGYAAGECNLGYMLLNGLGIEKDETEAVRWYRKAAEQGLADAQTALAALLQSGEGMKKD